MKLKNSIISLILLVFLFEGNAQVKLSIEPILGYTGQWSSWKDKEDARMEKDSGSYPFFIKPGYRPMLHIRASHHLAKNFYLTYGVGYHWFGHTHFDERLDGYIFELDGTTTRFNSALTKADYHYVGLNLGLKYQLWNKLNFLLEGYLYEMVYARNKHTFYHDGDVVFNGELKWTKEYGMRYLRPYHAGYHIGISHQVTPWFSIGLGYLGSFVHLYEFEKGTHILVRHYNHALTASLSFDITLKKGKKSDSQLNREEL